MKIFNSVLIFVLLTTVASAIKILRPGDMVKGKKITETYYCLNEQENLEILNKMNTVDLLKNLVQMKEQQISSLETTIELLKLQLKVREDQTDAVKTLYENSTGREEQLAAEVKKQEHAKNVERRRRKRSFWGGLIAGVAAALKVVSIVK